MPLLNCNECDNKISAQARACPKCGARTPKEPTSGLSTFLWVIAILGIILWISATNTTNKAPIQNEPSTQSEETLDKMFEDDKTFKEHEIAGRKIANKAIALIEKKPNWERVQPTMANIKLGYILEIIYKEAPSDDEVERDVNLVAQALILATGHNFGFRGVNATMHTKDKTGKEIIHSFGFTRYEYPIEALVFHPDNHVYSLSE